MWLHISAAEQTVNMFAGHCCELGPYRVWVAEAAFRCSYPGTGDWNILVVDTTL